MAASAEVATTNDPPLVDSYCALLLGDELGSGSGFVPAPQALSAESLTVLQRDLPMIDLKCLTSGEARERDVCADAMASAASEWGFFQVTSHGVRRELLEGMRREQAVLFHQPFDTKEKAGLVDGSYRWGNPTATSLRQLSWSEAFHVPLASICGEDGEHAQLSSLSLRGVMQEVADAMSRVADTVAGTLARNLGHAGSTFPAAAGCDGTTCFLRLNRYPACPFADTFGMVPHTDSDFLTIVCQDQVGGLEIMNGSHWVAVKPHPDALVVNVGDLFQAWSNNRYKSVEHKVVANSKAERFSIAYFLCPSHDSLIGTCGKPSPYRPFTFGEYRRKVQDDVRQTGKKIGLPNFLKCSTIS
ncbi:gibberellin 2-beta-dioxygenase 6-like [Aegilops tauschii subsp. strangulata]|uniref:gibberellin 2-beta-dioxygenase 6-like n=1 Tax=Aegilops tauschii subsp. strangulata TaxID=200361 RepID=UPI00098BA8DB|nr:gibberellin 2-beta-dioxygenase 6-like [Aegilops tauschii subsp. strangulata]